ncbi:hypothetical protein [Asticcacaulis sp. MM231]|uniref:hypothetical protein n=1 Tax=Asticcacaulis sp. MM231 TaxID=3157666 RepID=UPI0032D5A324
MPLMPLDRAYTGNQNAALPPGSAEHDAQPKLQTAAQTDYKGKVTDKPELNKETIKIAFISRAHHKQTPSKTNLSPILTKF